MTTPILVCGFNRPGHLRQVLQRLKNMDAKSVIVSIDGAEDDKNLELVQDCLKVASMFKPDTVTEIWHDGLSLGSGLGVYRAVDRFFEDHEFGIVLEDDTLPSYQFLDFCNPLLKKYAEDDRIGMIQGTNHVSDSNFESSYIFTKNKGTWGWASWRRAWKGFSLEKESLSIRDQKNVWLNMGWSRQATIQHWSKAFQLIEDRKVDAWDWQWFEWIALNNYLTITPKVNLVSNIGFGPEATHTKGEAPEIFLKIGTLEFPLVHPKTFAPDAHYETGFESIKYFFSPKEAKTIVRSSTKAHQPSRSDRLYKYLPEQIRETLLTILRRTKTIEIVKRIIDLGK